MKALRSLLGDKAIGLIGVCFLLGGCPRAWWWAHHGGGDDDGNGGGSSATDAGSAEQRCGTRGLPPCPEGEYCNFPESAECGEADAPGLCVQPPEDCPSGPEAYDPVCTCDGQTYASACLAARHLLSVRFAGECNPRPRCGGLENLKCAEGEYCDYYPAEMCGGPETTGRCVPDSEGCTGYAPECGCDGNLYANACEAQVVSGGVAGYVSGACAGGPCDDAKPYAQCPEGQYCSYGSFGIGCRAPDGLNGRCRLRPEVCTEQYDPVCGCDGVTYGNACIAEASAMSVRARGACP